MADAPVLDKGEEEDGIDLPPGFRFHPTDEEIITHYLSPKFVNRSFCAAAIGEVDLYKCEPWDLPNKSKMEEKERYFFCQRDRKYPTGTRTNRATEAGYWKATGKDREIYKGRGILVGMRKTLVFYKGRAPKGEKTNWVMHEFRLEGRAPHSIVPQTARDEWVVCRVFHKNIGIKKGPVPGLERMSSFGDDFLDSSTLPPLMDPSYYGSNIWPTPSYINEGEGFEFKGIPCSSSSMSSSYYSSMLGVENRQDISLQASSGNQPQNSVFYPQVPPQNTHFSLPEPASLGYLHHDDAMLRALAASNAASSAAIRRPCKVEQYSDRSMISRSQETGPRADRKYTEISTMVSKHYDGLEEPCSAGSVMDLDNMWKY